MKFSKEEVDKVVDEIIQVMEEKELKLDKFTKDRRDEVMETSYNFIKDGQNVIDSEGILYHPDDYPITSDDFYMLTESLRREVSDLDWDVDEDIAFPNKSIIIEYKDCLLELFYMYGQGTFVVLRLYKEED